MIRISIDSLRRNVTVEWRPDIPRGSEARRAISGILSGRSVDMAHRVVRLVVCTGCLVLAVVPETRLAGAQGTPAIDRPMPYMQAMNRVFRLLQQQVNDPSRNRSTLALAADLEWSTLSAKDAVPLRSTILPDDDRQAMLVAYRRLFLKLIRQELDLEEALLNDDQVAAARTVAAMEATENEGHQKFR